jgi:hypothetical protein
MNLLIEFKPKKIIYHAWLALQNRLWTADRLRRWGWTNCGFARYASKPKKPTTTYLFIAASPQGFGSFLKIGLAFMGSTQGKGGGGLIIQDFWSSLAEGPSHHRKGLASLPLLAVWEIWKE